MGGTSNWQNIAFCVEALMKINPQRVLDVGVGFGRWGMMIREFCEVWFGRVHRKDWQIRVEGVEAYQPNIADYHGQFYDQIHIGDLAALMPDLKGPWDLIILGDVLEHFVKDTGHRLLRWAYEQSSYLMINLPLGPDWDQDDRYGNPYERHLSAWREKDFKEFRMVRLGYFLDFRQRPFASMILSRENPAGLAELNPPETTLGNLDMWFSGRAESAMAELVAREGEVLENLRREKEELINIRWSYSYRLVQGLKKAPPVRWAEKAAEGLVFKPLKMAAGKYQERKLANSEPWDHVWLENISRGGADDEIWLLAVEREGRGHLREDRIQWAGDWQWESDDATSSGRRFVCRRQGTASIQVEPGDSLVFLAHPQGGKVKLTRRGRLTELDLNNPRRRLKVYNSASHEISERPLPETEPGPEGTGNDIPIAAWIPRQEDFSPGEQAWIKARLADPRPVSVANPFWRGIYSSTEELFSEIYDLPDVLTLHEADHHALVLKEAGLKQVVIQGLPLAYGKLVRSLRRLAPDMKIYLLWHGSFLQAVEGYAWKSFKVALELWRDGLIHKLGFVKKGMAEVMATEGRPSGFVMNLVRRIPEGPSQPLEGGPHLGNWNLMSNWRKPVFGMLMASRLIPGAVVHTSGAKARELEFIEVMGINCQATTKPLTKSALLGEMGRMHLNLYVTLSECAPMVPLESLSVGSPCLFGPNSHYFQDHPELHKYLVVPYPDSAKAIAEQARVAIENRDEIIRLYREYAPGYNQRALESLQRFLAD